MRAIEIRRKILGEKHPDYATLLNNLAGLYQSQGEYGKALILFQQAMTLTKEVLGEKHPDYATSLNNLAGLYESQGEYGKALTLYQHAMALTKEVLGEKHPDYVTSLNNLAFLYESQGEYSRALPLYQQAMVLYKKVLGEKHPLYATSLNNLAGLYYSQGKYGKALPLFKQAMAIKKATLGEKHPSYALSLNNLALLHVSQGKYSEALPRFKQAMAIRKEVLGENHPEYAGSLINLAGLYQIQGEYGKALPLYEQARAVTKEVLGEKHPAYATSMDNLALLYDFQGEYGKALSLYQKAMAIRKVVQGEKHPEYANCLNNLALLYVSQGEYGKALPLYQQAIALRKEVLGEKHPHYATLLNNLAALYCAQGQYGKALPLYQQAMAIDKKMLGEKHPDYANSLNNLAEWYSSQEKYGKALPLYKQALVLYKEVWGVNHPLYANSLNSLAMLYRSQGEYGKALPRLKQALTIRKAMLGGKHPDYASSLNNLAYVYYAQKDFKQAEKYFLLGAKASLEVRLQVSQAGLQRAAHTSEHSHLVTLAGILAHKGKVAQAWHWLEQSLGRATFDEVTARKKRTHQEQQQLDQIQGHIQHTEQRLKELVSQLKLSEEQKQMRQRWLSEQSQRYAQLAKLYKQLEEKYGITEGKSYSLKQIQSVLADDAAYLTWIDAASEHWVVLVRASGDPIFQRMNVNDKDWTKEDNVLPAMLYPLLKTNRGNSTEQTALLEKLRKQRIGPVAEYLKGIEHVIVLPSPLMDKIPIELLLPEKKVSHAPSATMYAYLKKQKKAKGNRLLALGDPIFNPREELKEKPMPESGILITSVLVDSLADKAGLEANDVLQVYDGQAVETIEDLNKAMASAQGKKEVRIKIWTKGKVSEQIIPTGTFGIVLSEEPAKIALKNRRKQQWQLVSRGDEWNALPCTRIEVASIAGLLGKDQRQVLLDSKASEQQLYQLASTDKLKEYKYLHFATHGEVNGFLPMQSALILSRDKLKGNVAELKANEPYFDGRLTAKEVALHWTLDADLVTLSACNSGLGKHARGEGYMGFAQSFLIRGSRSVVLSLWSVDDTATALLMTRFYENLLRKKMSKIDALRKAKKWLRTLPRSEALTLTAKLTNGVARGHRGKGFKVPLLNEVPKTKKKEDAPYAHPYYWSAFILIGDPN